MSVGYEKEQRDLQVKIVNVKSQIDEQKNVSCNTVKFLDIVRKYSEIDRLDSVILNDLIDTIVVHMLRVKAGRTGFRRLRLIIGLLVFCQLRCRGRYK